MSESNEKSGFLLEAANKLAMNKNLVAKVVKNTNMLDFISVTHSANNKNGFVYYDGTKYILRIADRSIFLGHEMDDIAVKTAEDHLFVGLEKGAEHQQS